MNEESSTEAYTLTYAKRRNLLCDSGNSHWGSDPEGWEVGGGRETQEGGDIMYVNG